MCGLCYCVPINCFAALVTARSPAVALFCVFSLSTPRRNISPSEKLGHKTSYCTKVLSDRSNAAQKSIGRTSNSAGSTPCLPSTAYATNSRLVKITAHIKFRRNADEPPLRLMLQHDAFVLRLLDPILAALAETALPRRRGVSVWIAHSRGFTKAYTY